MKERATPPPSTITDNKPTSPPSLSPMKKLMQWRVAPRHEGEATGGRHRGCKEGRGHRDGCRHLRHRDREEKATGGRRRIPKEGRGHPTPTLK